MQGLTPDPEAAWTASQLTALLELSYELDLAKVALAADGSVVPMVEAELRTLDGPGLDLIALAVAFAADEVARVLATPAISGSPDIKVGRSPGRSDQELCDLGRNRLIHGFFWDLPEQYFLASVDGRLRRPRSGWGACSAAAKSRRKVFNLWLLLDDRWAGDTAQVEPVR